MLSCVLCGLQSRKVIFAPFLWYALKSNCVTVEMKILSTEKKQKAQCESCELSFVWSKMRTIAQETAFQMALGNCSKEAGGKVSIIYDFSEGEGTCSQAHMLAEPCCKS